MTAELEITDEIRYPQVDVGVDERLMSCAYALIEYEESSRSIWIKMCYTHEGRRNEGYMRALIARLKQKNKNIIPGVYTDEGALYIKRYFTQQ